MKKFKKVSAISWAVERPTAGCVFVDRTLFVLFLCFYLLLVVVTVVVVCCKLCNGDRKTLSLFVVRSNHLERYVLYIFQVAQCEHKNKSEQRRYDDETHITFTKHEIKIE
jgi:hypothetical protein